MASVSCPFSKAADRQAFAKSGSKETKAAKKQAKFEDLKEIFGM